MLTSRGGNTEASCALRHLGVVCSIAPICSSGNTYGQCVPGERRLPRSSRSAVLLNGRSLRLSAHFEDVLTRLLASPGTMIPSAPLAAKPLARLRSQLLAHGFSLYRVRSRGYLLLEADQEEEWGA